MKIKELIVNIVVKAIQQLIMFAFVAMGLAAMLMVVSVSEGNVQYVVPLAIICAIFFAVYQYAKILEEKEDRKENDDQ